MSAVKGMGFLLCLFAFFSCLLPLSFLHTSPSTCIIYFHNPFEPDPLARRRNVTSRYVITYTKTNTQTDKLNTHKCGDQHPSLCSDERKWWRRRQQRCVCDIWKPWYYQTIKTTHLRRDITLMACHRVVASTQTCNCRPLYLFVCLFVSFCFVLSSHCAVTSEPRAFEFTYWLCAGLPSPEDKMSPSLPQISPSGFFVTMVTRKHPTILQLTALPWWYKHACFHCHRLPVSAKTRSERVLAVVWRWGHVLAGCCVEVWVNVAAV